MSGESVSPKRLFDLRNVPDDEADEVRALLESHGIEFYETRPAALGLLAGALWLRDATTFDEAKGLLANYQQQRQLRARAEYQRAREEGRAETLGTSIRQEPMKVALWLLIVVFILALALFPFLFLGNAR